MKRSLYHLLYTNAPGAGGAGYRHVPVSFPDTCDPAPIQKWLETLQQVTPAANEGWAFYSFGIGRTLFPVLAVVNPRFSPEDHDRGQTVLVHGFVLPLGEGETVGQFGRALYERAKKFLDDSRANYQVTLDSYLTGCRTFSDLDIKETEPRELCHLEARFLGALFAAASLPVKTVTFPGVQATEDLPEQILWASAALPPPLRLQLRWRVGLQPGAEGFVGSPGEDQGGNLESKGAAFHEWLQQALSEQRFEAVRQISENWEIRDWEGLVKILRTLADQPAVGALPPQSEVSEEKEMAKKRAPAVSDKPVASRPGKSAAAYDEEYQSLQKNLEEYVNRRLANLRGGDGPPVAISSGGAGPSGRFGAWFRTWRPEIYLVSVLLILGWIYRPSFMPEDPGVAIPPQPTLGPQTELTSDLEPSPPLDPLESWGVFVNENKSDASAWFRALAEHRELEARQVKAPVADKFKAWAQQLEQGEALDEKYYQESLTGLVEYIHARWAQDNGNGDPTEDQVTFNPDEVQRNLSALLTELNLDDDLGPQAKVTDLAAQMAVARTWLERHPQP